MPHTQSHAIRDRLVKHGSDLFNAPSQTVEFTQIPQVDALLNDLDKRPHAFVLACVMDRQIKAERAWQIPHKFQTKLEGDFSIERLAALSLADTQNLMSKPEPLHRFVESMSRHFHAAVQRIVKEYAGNAANIWRDTPPSAEVVYRFLEFDGVGPKIASMAANILARDFKIPLADHYSIDISADVHVRRVFSRLALIPRDASIEQLIFKARALHPAFPGLMDFPAWEIGRKWCRPQSPNCTACYMHDICPGHAQAGTTRL